MLVLLVDGGLRPSDMRASRGARRFSCSESNIFMLLREPARSGDSWRGLTMVSWAFFYMISFDDLICGGVLTLSPSQPAP